MRRKAIFVVVLIGISILLITNHSHAQSCPDLKLDAKSANLSYLEIQSEGKSHQIPLPDIMVFPEGKERIYCLLPDILTLHNTPIIEWNELVLKKGLNTTDKWQGSIDRAKFHPTPCLPELAPTNFTNALSASDFYYVSQANMVSIKGNISFANINGNQITLHLNIVDQAIPKPRINNLSGKIVTPTGEMEVISGEIGFDKNSEILRGSGIASSDLGNQGFEFSIPRYSGDPGTYVANEGDEKHPLFAVYKVMGDPSTGLEIHKYELPSANINFKSFYDKRPFNLDSLALNNLNLKSKLSSSSIAIDPKPTPVVVPLFNTAFNERRLGMETLQKVIDNQVNAPPSWKEDLTITLRSYPIWKFQVEESIEESKPKKLVIKNVISEAHEASNNDSSINMDQVNVINEGFTEIFQSFDEDSDTLQLKKTILLLFSENNLPTIASVNDDFETFLTTTVTEFREQTKMALNKDQNPNADLSYNGNEKLSIELTLDQQAQFPLVRQYETKDTKIEIHYADTISIIANNPIQGEQILKLPGNPGLYDIYQFYGVLKQLPLSVGFETNLGFFDLSVQTQVLTTKTKQIERQLIIPDYIHASIMVDEELSIKDEPVYKINVKFHGLKNSLFVESYQSELSGIYYLTKSPPHQLIKAIFEGGIVLE